MGRPRERFRLVDGNPASASPPFFVQQRRDGTVLSPPEKAKKRVPPCRKSPERGTGRPPPLPRAAAGKSAPRQGRRKRTAGGPSGGGFASEDDVDHGRIPLFRKGEKKQKSPNTVVPGRHGAHLCFHIVHGGGKIVHPQVLIRHPEHRYHIRDIAGGKHTGEGEKRLSSPRPACRRRERKKEKRRKPLFSRPLPPTSTGGSEKKESRPAVFSRDSGNSRFQGDNSVPGASSEEGRNGEKKEKSGRGDEGRTNLR